VQNLNRGRRAVAFVLRPWQIPYSAFRNFRDVLGPYHLRDLLRFPLPRIASVRALFGEIAIEGNRSRVRFPGFVHLLGRGHRFESLQLFPDNSIGRERVCAEIIHRLVVLLYNQCARSGLKPPRPFAVADSITSKLRPN